MKSLITKLEIDEIKNVLANDKFRSLKEFKFPKNAFNITIGSIAITIAKSGKKYIQLGSDVTTEYLKEWRRDVGSLLNRDLTKRQNLDNYLEIKWQDKIALLRGECESDGDLLDVRNQRHLLVNDKWYTVIKIIKKTESYAQKPLIYDKYDDESDIINIKPLESDIDIDEDVICVPLFED